MRFGRSSPCPQRPLPWAPSPCFAATAGRRCRASTFQEAVSPLSRRQWRVLGAPRSLISPHCSPDTTNVRGGLWRLLARFAFHKTFWRPCFSIAAPACNGLVPGTRAGHPAPVCGQTATFPFAALQNRFPENIGVTVCRVFNCTTSGSLQRMFSK